MLKKILFSLALAASSLVPTTATAVTFTESFAARPSSTGWKTFGETNLFHWDSSNQNLAVTWNSSQPNSYYYRPLGTVLAKDNDFSLAFDLKLSEIAIGVDTNKPYTFQLGMGLVNLAQATNAAFVRGSGFEAPNLVEFDYFPDSGFGATVSTPVISTNNEYASGGFTVGLELTRNDLFHIEMVYSASNQTLKTTMTKNGANVGPVEDTVLGPGFSDFRVDAVAVTSYSDAGQDPNYGGSILARGAIDNIVVTVPEPPIGNLRVILTENSARVSFQSRTNWQYVLERTFAFDNWEAVSPITAGSGTTLELQDTNPNADGGFYRVRATRP